MSNLGCDRWHYRVVFNIALPATTKSSVTYFFQQSLPMKIEKCVWAAIAKVLAT